MAEIPEHLALAEPVANGDKPPERLAPAVVLPAAHAQAILNYLTNCPYAQVHELVAHLLAAKEHTCP